MAIETTITLSPNLHSYYHKKLLENARKKLRLWPLGNKKIHPKGTGLDSFVLRFGHVAASTSTLTEGTPPAEAVINTNKYTITVRQYGQFVKMSDLLLTTAIDPVLEDVAEELGYTAALSTDTIIMNHLIANATNNLQYVGAGNSADNDIAANETFVAADAVKATRIFRGNDAPAMDDGLYVWVVHPFVGVDMQTDTSAGGFIELTKYTAANAESNLNGEIGKAYGSRVVESTNVQSAANGSSVNVYRTMMFAKDAFCVSSFDKDHIDLIVKQQGSAGTADPLNQLATAGYKLQFGVQYVGGEFSQSNGASPDLCLQIRGAATGG